jgi:hypothetical protein
MKANFEVHHVESAKSASRSMSDLERHWRDVVAQQSRKFSEAESAHSEVERQLRSQIASFRGFHGNAVLEVEQQYERRLSDLREEFARLTQKMNADMTAKDNRVFLLEEQLEFERNQARANVSEREQELRRTVKQLTVRSLRSHAGFDVSFQFHFRFAGRASASEIAIKVNPTTARRCGFIPTQSRVLDST